MNEDETLAELLRELIEAQMQIALVLASAFPKGPPQLLTDHVSEKFLRMAAILEAGSSAILPSELATSLHTNGLRLRNQRGPDGTT